MYLKRLSLTNFKNIAETQLEFSEKINCLLGNNGMGKSNLLDAVYFLSFCKSFSGMTDAQLIRRGEDFAIAKANYIRRETPEELQLGLAKNRRKTLKRGGKEYQRLSQHIGTFPLVMAAPQDIDLIRGSGEERRRWADMVISQGDARYLDSLIRYNAALEQRNRLLRAGIVDHTLYEAIEAVMDIAARYIYQQRSQWVSKLQDIFARYYSAIAADGEIVSLAYRGCLDNAQDGSLAGLLDQTRRHDEIVKYTSVGPHRDDIEFSIEGMPLRRSGSQGQCKTFTIALRLAQYEFLREATGLRPILLLDDIFDKLDADRVGRIMELVTDPAFGQIFVTDTNRQHLDDIIGRLQADDYRLWSVQSGVFTPITATSAEAE